MREGLRNKVIVDIVFKRMQGMARDCGERRSQIGNYVLDGRLEPPAMLPIHRTRKKDCKSEGSHTIGGRLD